MVYNPENLKQDFLKKCHLKYGDKYDYSKIKYVGAHVPLEIICPKHGTFFKRPAAHLYGSGECKQCFAPLAKYYRHDNTKIISLFRERHGDFYDYSQVEYKKYHSKVIIVCRKHGPFPQSPAKHLSGRNCPNCAAENINKEKIMPFDDFCNKSNKIHINKYKYIESSYINAHSKINIICPKHGEFSQLTMNHIKGVGCPRCANSISKQENFVKNFLIKNNIPFIERDREQIKPYELDFYIPSKNLAIECNGVYWHSEACGKYQNYHLDKTNNCKKKNIRLIQVLENEIKRKPKAVLAKLNSILNIKKYKINADDCQIEEINKKTGNKFLNKYHIMGADDSDIILGLTYKNRLVSLMAFRKQRDMFKLSRTCSIVDFHIENADLKLLSYFEKMYKPEFILFRADKRWSEGNFYKELGFKYVKDSLPRRKRIGRHRVWDCGCVILEKKYPENTLLGK